MVTQVSPRAGAGWDGADMWLASPLSGEEWQTLVAELAGEQAVEQAVEKAGARPGVRPGPRAGGRTGEWSRYRAGERSAGERSGDAGEGPEDAGEQPGELRGEQPGGHALPPSAAGRADALEPWRLWEPGGLSRPGESAGLAFSEGGVGEGLSPGVVLAALAEQAWEDREHVSDDELIGVMRAWRRLSSWVAARELAAVAELAARREAQVEMGADPHVAEHVSDEVAAALRLTSRSADLLVDFAYELGRLPATREALETGRIDRTRAGVIAGETGCLKAGHAAAVEAAVIGRAPDQTSGQLRASVRRAVLAADPTAADRRRKEALKEARVETWDEQSGTAALAGRDLRPADVLAADQRIDGFARQLKHAGADGTLAGLRARVFTALLTGIPLHVLHADLCGAQAAGGEPDSVASGAAALTGAAGLAGLPGADAVAGAAGLAGAVDASLAGSVPGLALAGSVNLVLPVTTWLGGNAPGEVGGYGPLPAADARTLARLVAAHPDARLCVTLTDAEGIALGHGCLSAGGGRRSRAGDTGCGQVHCEGHSQGAGPFPELTFTLRPLAAGSCDHRGQVAGYRPSRVLCHRVVTRQRRCSFPGCRRAANRCDLDHTVPHGQGGRTCECNLAPLCRRHHRAKQAGGWQLEQPEPGLLVWTLPHGRSYRTRPDPYPADGP